MLSTMEAPPAVLPSRPIIDGASGALNSDTKSADSPGTPSTDADAALTRTSTNTAEETRTDAKSVSDSIPNAVADAGSHSIPESGADSAKPVNEAVKSDSVIETDSEPMTNSHAITDSNSAGEQRSVAVPDLDNSAEERCASGAGVALDTSGRSELEETPEEVELRLSGSEGTEPAPEDEDLLLRDDEDGDEAQASADPVDLPDDMFESAAALNAAEEEQERLRREANELQRRRALEEADSLDSLLDAGDSMDVDDARPPVDVSEDVSMDVPEVVEDVASPAGDLEPPSDPENSMASSTAGGEADVEPIDLADDAGEAEDSRDAGEVVEDADDPDDPGAPDDPGNPDDPDDPDDPPVSSRKRAASPSAEPDTSKVRRVEPTRPFIAVKKVQLNENNLRILQESQERDRRRLEETTAPGGASPATPAPATPAVNGVRSSLLQRVKQLTRTELETLVLEKMCDAIASRSVIGDMKKSAEKHVIAAERFQKKITYLQKQVGDLHLVVRKLSAELKTRRSPSYPVKITRTVGLQVTLAKSIPPLSARPRPGVASPGTAGGGSPATTGPGGTPSTNGAVLRAQLSSPGRPRQIVRTPAPQAPVLRAQLPTASLVNRRGRPPAVAPAGTAVALLPVVRTLLPISSVAGLPSLGSPQRTAAPASPANVPGSPGSTQKTAVPAQPKQLSFSGSARGRPRGGRPPRQIQPAPSSGSSATDVVDLTDDDDPKRPAARGGGPPAVSPRKPAGVTSVTPVNRSPGRISHPAPFPVTPPNPAVHTGQLLPPPPLLKVTRRANGIVLSWNMDLTSRHASVVSYHLFAYQESGPVSIRTNPWKKVGDVRALPLPMACTLTQFQEGHKYHFAVRAEDSFRRRGPFSNPSSIALVGS